MRKGERRLQLSELNKAADYLGEPIPTELASPLPADSAPSGIGRGQGLDDKRLRRLAEAAIELALAATHQRVGRQEINAWAETAVRLFRDV